ncbi:hypothetical protein JTE90_004016 [Oedothorax gibbosus]|uniref:Uncharacterized protein n=1 Tax=Oedothorax gibbosus TaxID=931172 RepID=A0AAV6U3Y5_9ARAC|nr:hypothetical protein JTE90_004016 [Oedothorax gibbosus]
MKRVFDAMSAKVFEQESAHIDRVLKNVHTEREKQENLMKVLVEDFGTLDQSISSAIGDLRVQVANIKSSTEALSSTPLSAPPPLQVLNTGPDAPRLLIQPKSFVILAYPEPTLNISNIQDFQSQLSTTSKKLNIHFKCSGSHNVVADTLSRIQEVCSTPLDFDDIARAQDTDPELQRLRTDTNHSLNLNP